MMTTPAFVEFYSNAPIMTQTAMVDKLAPRGIRSHEHSFNRRAQPTSPCFLASQNGILSSLLQAIFWSARIIENPHRYTMKHPATCYYV
jgi:hypothetical protein